MVRKWRELSVLWGLSLVACAGAPAPPPSAPPAPRAARPAPAVAPLPPDTEALRRALLALWPEAAVTSALPEPLRASLEAVLQQLSPAQRQALVTAEVRGLVEARPLLHLLAGGDAPEALFALASSGAASEELLLARQHARLPPDAALVPVARRVAQRAGQRWLSESARALSAAKPGVAQRCAQIALVARNLELEPLRGLALKAAVENEPSVGAWLELARWSLEQGELEPARAALERARGLAASAAQLAELEALVKDAEQVAAALPEPAASEQLLPFSRALLRLRRYAALRALLGPRQELVTRHLGLSAALAMADATGGTCPGLAGVEHLVTCALDVLEGEGAAQRTAALEAAWKSGQGRDEAAMQAYLGLVHVMPWTYASVLPPSAQGSASGAPLVARFEALRQTTAALAQAQPALAGLAVFVDTLGVGLLKASRGPLPRERTPAGLRARALALAGHAELEAQVALLGIAALLMQQDDVRPLLGALPAELAPGQRAPRAMLLTWSAAARPSAESAEQARSALTAALPEGASGELARAELLLLLAELDVAISPEARQLEVLEKLSAQLSSAGVPPGLRLRAALDGAGARARLGHPIEAIGALDQLLSELRPEELPDAERDLLTLVQAARLALLGNTSSGKARADALDQLRQLTQAPAFAALPPSTRLWYEAWLVHLGARQQAERCTTPACEAALERRSKLAASVISQRLGAESGKIFQRGSLPSGSLKLNLGFENGRVRPAVGVDLRLLALPFPSWARTSRP